MSVRGYSSWTRIRRVSLQQPQMVRRPHVSRQVTNIFKCYQVKRQDGVRFIVFVELQTTFCSLILNLSKSWIRSSFPYYASERCGNKGSRVFRDGAVVRLPQLLYKPDHNTCKHVLKPIVKNTDMGRQCSFLHSM